MNYIVESTTVFNWAKRGRARYSRTEGQFDDPSVREDVEGQHQRLNSALKESGFKHPDPLNRHHPLWRWVGGSSGSITNLLLDRHKGMSPKEEVDQHGQYNIDLERRLDDEIGKGTRLDEHVVAYSGISPKFGQHLMSLTKDTSFASPAHISASISPGAAFTRSFQGHMVNIHLPKGSKPGLYIGGLSPFSHEKEFIVRKNRSFIYAGRQILKSASPVGKDLTVHHFIDDTSE